MKDPVNETAEAMFGQYLELVKLDPATMPEEQTTELKRAFNGALGMVLVLVKQTASKYRGNPKKINKVLNDLQKELWQYWRREGGGNIFDEKH